MPAGESGIRVRMAGDEELIGDAGGLVGGGRLGARLLLAHRRLALAKVGDGLVADGDELDVDVLRLELGDARLRLLDGGGVVGAAEAAVAGDHDRPTFFASRVS